ncbi:MAG: hypothetical protein DWQ36_14965 [Acidobacteria bacterium]|nr:MAG: hypothetical protein DWQ30_00065 [Acidobacteriota bacterium]REK06192.1 MAG: hypothetical protein DWQ36_14965 [Acidobacteriota bacterium]
MHERELQIGAWRVFPDEGRLERPGVRERLEPRVMDLLVFLARHQEQVVSQRDLVRHVWEGAFVSEGALHTAVAALRRSLGDDARRPRYIQTVPRRGYRLIAPVSRRRRLAVLPLASGDLGPVNRGPDADSAPGEEVFAYGMTDALIEALGRCPELEVVSLRSVMVLRDRKATLPEVARDLAVDWVVEGSVLRSSEAVRISVRLLDGPADRMLWSQGFERPLEDTFGLQRELAAAISDEIARRSSPDDERIRADTGGPAVSAEALDHFLRGRFHFYKLGPPHIEQALGHFEAAVRIEPSFGDAHAGIADVRGAMAYWGQVPFAEVREGIDSAISQALLVDPGSAEAHSIQAVQHLFVHRDYVAAAKSLDRALELNPSSSHALLIRVLHQMILGRQRQALMWSDRFRRIDPLNPAAGLAHALALSSRPGLEEPTAAVLQATLEIDPEHQPTHQLLADLAWHGGRIAEALAHERAWWMRDPVAARLLPHDPAEPASGAAARVVLERLADHLVTESERRYVQPIEIARLQALCGRPAAALDWLERAGRTHDLRLLEVLRLHPRWATLRGEERYLQLFADLGLTL